MNAIKTAVLLAALMGLFIFFGGLFGGKTGVIIAFIIGMLLNFVMYWFSDKIVLSMYGAKPVEAKDAPELHGMVQNLASRMELPMPKVYIIAMAAPNAFATGRDPAHSAVAVSPSIMSLLSKHELEAVLAHELSHIRHRDTLIATMAAGIASAISMLANLAYFAAIFGGRGGDDDDGNPLVLLVLAILTPIVAMFIQMAISRSREYEADSGAAVVTHRPNSMKTALEKIHGYAKKAPIVGGSPSTASLFIANPYKESWMINMLSTHPSLARRLKNLEKTAEKLGLPY
ncbi:MAG: zinc metalloprotease HtpX [Candidatus Firestonebacteria bacterium]